MYYCIGLVDMYQAARRNFPQYFDPQPYFLLAQLTKFYDLQQKPKYLRRQILLPSFQTRQFSCTDFNWSRRHIEVFLQYYSTAPPSWRHCAPTTRFPQPRKIDQLSHDWFNLQAEEVEREKTLVLAGKMPVNEASMELMEHPVFKISQLTKSIIQEKERKVSGVEWRRYNGRLSTAFAKGHNGYGGLASGTHLYTSQ